MLTFIALLLVGIWLILTGVTVVSDTLTLIFGIAVVVLVLIELLTPYYHRRTP